MIDTTSLVKFGDMVKGGGLAAILLPTNIGTGYSETTSGYVGVVLSAPTAIKEAVVVSASNGFDASGSTSPITLKLYGSNSMPISPTNGDLLCSTTFTDINATTTKTLVSTNQITTYTHVWVAMYSGVWCILEKISFNEATVSDSVINVTTNSVIIKSANEVIPLTWNGDEILQYRTKPILVNQNGVINVDLFANLTHRGDHTGYLGVVGYSGGVYSRSADNLTELLTKPFVRLPNAVSGGNIIDRDPHHYGAISINVATPIICNKYYQFTVYGSSHSTGSSSNGLAAVLSEYGNGLNALRLTVNYGYDLIQG